MSNIDQTYRQTILTSLGDQSTFMSTLAVGATLLSVNTEVYAARKNSTMFTEVMALFKGMAEVRTDMSSTRMWVKHFNDHMFRVIFLASVRSQVHGSICLGFPCVNPLVIGQAIWTIHPDEDSVRRMELPCAKMQISSSRAHPLSTPGDFSMFPGNEPLVCADARHYINGRVRGKEHEEEVDHLVGVIYRVRESVTQVLSGLIPEYPFPEAVTTPQGIVLY